MQVQTVLKTDGTTLPSLEMDQTRLILASDGVFQERRTSVFHSSTKVELSSFGLAEHGEFCQLSCGKINRSLHRAMLSFFKHVHGLYGGEAALVLLYDFVHRRFRWYCPLQSLAIYWHSGRWITSDNICFQNPTVLPEGYIHFGDAHLHVGSVTPSLTDLHDDQDGLHIIVADINGFPKYHVDFVVDGKRFRVPPNLIFEDPHCLAFDRPPRGWCQRVRVEKYVPYQSQNRGDDCSNEDQWNRGNGGYGA